MRPETANPTTAGTSRPGSAAGQGTSAVAFTVAEGEVTSYVAHEIVLVPIAGINQAIVVVELTILHTAGIRNRRRGGSENTELVHLIGVVESCVAGIVVPDLTTRDAIGGIPTEKRATTIARQAYR